MPALNLDFRDWWHWGIELLRGDRHRSIYGRRRAELIWGVAAVAVTLVAVLVAAGVYVYAPGHYRVKAEFAEAGQISPGDSVRVAGVPVGTVKSVVLDSDHVDVEMAVRWGTVLGDQTRADVKMLTIVGGSFIDLTTAGRGALGDTVIPVARTSVPYTVMETFETIQPKLDDLEATPLRETLVQLDQALEENPGGIRKSLDIARSMLVNLQKRQDQFGAMLRLAADYSEQINASGDVITQLGRNLSTFVSEYAVFGPRLNVVLHHLASLLERVRGIALFYADDVQPLVDQLDRIGRDFGPALARYTPMIEQGRDLIKRLEGMVAPDGSIVIDQSDWILSADFCIPMPGVKC